MVDHHHPVLVMIKSSAKAWVLTPGGSFSFKASLITMFHNMGDNVLPWGQPFSIRTIGSVSWSCPFAEEAVDDLI